MLIHKSKDKAYEFLCVNNNMLIFEPNENTKPIDFLEKNIDPDKFYVSYKIIEKRFYKLVISN